jgi:hypothetical protein
MMMMMMMFTHRVFYNCDSFSYMLYPIRSVG